jgi:hypothetical protein
MRIFTGVVTLKKLVGEWLRKNLDQEVNWAKFEHTLKASGDFAAVLGTPSPGKGGRQRCWCGEGEDVRLVCVG